MWRGTINPTFDGKLMQPFDHTVEDLWRLCDAMSEHLRVACFRYFRDNAGASGRAREVMGKVADIRLALGQPAVVTRAMREKNPPVMEWDAGFVFVRIEEAPDDPP